MIWLEHYGKRLNGFMGYVVDEAEGADWANGAERADGTMKWHYARTHYSILTARTTRS